MIRGIFGLRCWLLVCAFALPGSLALAQCSKTYSYQWTGPAGIYQVRMSGTILVTWNPTSRNITFTTTLTGERKNGQDEWVSGAGSVKLYSTALNGGARIGSTTLYGGNYTLHNGVTVITLLAGHSPTFETECLAIDWFGGTKKSGINGAIDMHNLTQSASASPNPLLISGGQSGDVNFAGAVEDGRAMKWQVELVSGSIDFTVDQEGNKATFTGGSPGIVQLRVRATPAACAPASDWENFSVQVSASYCVSWLISNGVGVYATAVSQNKDYADEYKATRNDVEVGVTTVLWGEIKQFKVDGLEDATPVKLFKKYTSSPWVWDEGLAIWVKPSGVQLVIESWKFVEEATPVIGCIQKTKGEADGDFLPPEVVNPVDPANPKPPPTDAPPAPPTTVTTTTPDGGTTGGKLITGPLWSSAADDTALTGKLYQEGVTHVVKELQAINNKLSATGAVGAANDVAIADAAEAGAGATDGDGEGTGAGAASDAVAQSMDGGPVTPSLSLPSGSASGLAIVGAYGVNIDLNPASNPLVSSLAEFIKQVVTWLAGVAFAWWCWGEFDRAVRHLLHAEQAKGNAIIGGTGGQATALIAAGAITALLIAVPLAFWAFATYDITPVSNPSGPGSIALYLLFFFLPVPYLLSLVTAAFVVRKAALVLVAATATLIRFVVP